MSKHPSVILLVPGKFGDAAAVREWLRTSRFATREASDIFQALEELSDFTVMERPDVVLLNSAAGFEDIGFVEDVVRSGTNNDCSVLALSDDRTSGSFSPAIRKLSSDLDRLIPARNSSFH